MIIPLSKKEKLFLEFIRVFTEVNGYSPTFEELKAEFNLRAVSTVHEHVTNLEKKGYISRTRNISRGIQVIDTILADQQMLEIPVKMRLNDHSVLSEYLKEDISIYFHRNQLEKKGHYLGILVDTNLYESEAILKGDLLLFIKQDHYPFQSKVLACVMNKFYYLGKMGSRGRVKTFEKFDKYHTVVKDFKVKGKLIALIRDFRNREFKLKRLVGE